MSSRLICRRLALAAFMAALCTASSLTGQERPHRLVLLGTGGGPAVKASRAQPANAVVVNGAVYVVDAGDGVARQMALAGLSVTALRAVFITHHHSDHNADYGTLLLRSWASGLRRPVATYGPPPLEQITRSYLEYMDWDVRLRAVGPSRVRPAGALARGRPPPLRGRGHRRAGPAGDRLLNAMLRQALGG